MGTPKNRWAIINENRKKNIYFLAEAASADGESTLRLLRLSTALMASICSKC